MAPELEPAVGWATGKVILLGEHAVVHGAPAIVCAVREGVRVAVVPAPGADTGAIEIGGDGGAPDPRVREAIEEALRCLGLPDGTRLRLEISGDLPIGMGLGSSAALSVATLRAIAGAAGRDAGNGAIGRAAHRLEAIFHGTPSGVDSTAATYGGLLWFEAGPPPRQAEIVPERPFDLVLAMPGERHDTKRTVAGVRARVQRHASAYRPVLQAIGDLVAAARVAIEGGDLPLLGELLTVNHGLLRTLGVSSPELDSAVRDAIAAGALGAKLTGGGGGGAIVALSDGPSEDLATALRRRGFKVLVAPVPPQRDPGSPRKGTS